MREGKLKAVLSPCHWIEAARARTDSEALRIARVMDSLDALWLRERRALQRREVQAWVQGKPGDRHVIEPICRAASEVASELSSFRGTTTIVTSQDMVLALRGDPQFSMNMAAAYRSNAEGFNRNVRHVRRGQLTPTKEQPIWLAWLQSVATEAGSTLSPEKFGNADRGFFPSILAEFELAKENWRRAVQNPPMKLLPQRLNDVFHVIVALPYTDYIVSDDVRFRRLIRSVRQKLPFSTAEPIGSLAELLRRL